jgi:hypothetical protein
LILLHVLESIGPLYRALLVSNFVRVAGVDFLCCGKSKKATSIYIGHTLQYPRLRVLLHVGRKVDSGGHLLLLILSMFLREVLVQVFD